MKRITAALAIASLALTLPTAASALPRSAEGFTEQLDICREGLEMIIGGASDAEELDMIKQRLRANGWEEESDLDDLLLLCAFYKQGYIYALPQ